MIKALVHDAMRAERPNAKFAGFTDVKDLADAIAGVWQQPAQEVNGQRLWLTSRDPGRHDPVRTGPYRRPSPPRPVGAGLHASDNYAGAHPRGARGLALANGGHQISYGEDEYTEHLQRVMHSHFGPTAEAFPVFNGTGANVTALQALADRWGAVVCAESAHINVDEGGAPERMAGLKLLTVPTPDGKLTPELIDRQAFGWDDEHRAMPQVVSIAQNTELGTVYIAGRDPGHRGARPRARHEGPRRRRAAGQRGRVAERPDAGVHECGRRGRRDARRHEERTALR